MPGIVISGRDLPGQFHLGRRCVLSPSFTIRDESWADDPDTVNVKPLGALWTSPVTEENARAAATTWSDLYYTSPRTAGLRQKNNPRRPWKTLLRNKFVTPERLWPVIPDPSARIVRLACLNDQLAAARQWPGRHGRIDFAAMARDGIDAVWVLPDIIPTMVKIGRAWDRPDSPLRAQFYGWDIESVAWLRPDKITVGTPIDVIRKQPPPLAEAAHQTALDIRAQFAWQPPPAAASDSREGSVNILDQATIEEERLESYAFLNVDEADGEAPHEPTGDSEDCFIEALSAFETAWESRVGQETDVTLWEPLVGGSPLSIGISRRDADTPLYVVLDPDTGHNHVHFDDADGRRRFLDVDAAAAILGKNTEDTARILYAAINGLQAAADTSKRLRNTQQTEAEVAADVCEESFPVSPDDGFDVPVCQSSLRTSRNRRSLSRRHERRAGRHG